MFKKTAIIGVGLLGGSLSLAMRERGLTQRVSGHSRRAENREWALKHGILDEAPESPEEAVAGADLLVLATPVQTIPPLLADLMPLLEPGAIVTDVGSVKKFIVEEAAKIDAPNVSFVGSHPMAGGEKFSVRNSRPALYEDCLTIVTKSAHTDSEALEKTCELWKSLGCRVIVMAPDEHDYFAAAASHLPHMIAVSLTDSIRVVSKKNIKVLPFLAGGFRDTTRIASGSPEMWRDISKTNRDQILKMLEVFRGRLDALESTIRGADGDELKKMFQKARDFRDDIPAQAHRGLGDLFQLQVEVPHRPGVLGELCTEIGKAGINIQNLFIRHVREETGGALTISFATEQERNDAALRLRDLGYHATFER